MAQEIEKKNSKKKEEYIARRQKTAKHMKSFTDSNGRVWTACDECTKKKCSDRRDGNGCMVGKLKESLQEYL